MSDVNQIEARPSYYGDQVASKMKKIGDRVFVKSEEGYGINHLHSMQGTIVSDAEGEVESFWVEFDVPIPSHDGKTWLILDELLEKCANLKRL